MKKSRNYIDLVMFIIAFILMIAIALIFWYTWNNFYRTLIKDPFYEKGSLLLTLVYLIIYFLFSRIYEGFRVGFLKNSEIIYSQSLSIIFTNFIIYMQISLLSKRLVNPVPLAIMTIVEIIVVIVWSTLCNKLYFRLFQPINMIMIYSNENVSNLLLKIKGHSDKYNICKSINSNIGLENIKREIEYFEAVIICDVDSSLRNKIVKYCYKKSIRIYLTPKISDIIIQSSDKLHIFDTPLLLFKNNGLSYTQKFFKRAMDITISFVTIIAILPLMIIAALLIKIYDGGPIVFKQKRLTINDKIFEIYKFRSMIVDAEKDGEARLASRNDCRITPVGKIIRKFRIDELPQLFNILKGDMSLVGPRPERPEIAEQYTELMPEFEFRTKVKAGLTGYAQVMGKYNTTPYDKLKLDLMYIGNYSIFMDLKLMLMTIKILFMSDSTEGIAEGEILPELAVSDNKK